MSETVDNLILDLLEWIGTGAEHLRMRRSRR